MKTFKQGVSVNGCNSQPVLKQNGRTTYNGVWGTAKILQAVSLISMNPCQQNMGFDKRLTVFFYRGEHEKHKKLVQKILTNQILPFDNMNESI